MTEYMSRAEGEFKGFVEALLRMDDYPSPSAIRDLQNAFYEIQHGQRHNLNGREVKWRLAVWEPWMNVHPDHPITLRRRRLEGHP